ncbi:MAG TPA: glycogen/starch synthase [Ignavibacteriales bacterium]|nr:glycogen/starch synthase [Ignavibacteriales bacterium]HOL81067.1 glycogen/starch synthase [Ignavibacteriales bacterium]HOM64802.1 glycogen/starch synthase [Ignavibacteriales bacterium]HPP32848.1 glycogen/starch synthase [Ignavibacteriales bacterium]
MAAKKLNILFVTSELIPFVQVGELANFSTQVTKVLADCCSDIRILIPKYGAISEATHKIHDIIRLKDLKCKIGNKTYSYSIKSSFILNKKSRIQVYFVDSPDLFSKRKGVYLEYGTWKDYPDNLERFSLFSRAAFELMEKLQWYPDIIHTNDWTSAIIPLYKKVFEKKNSHLKKIKTILTVHNFSFQGVFPLTEFEKLGLPDEFKEKEYLQIWDQLNFLKGGLETHDHIVGQSNYDLQKYIKEEKYSYGLKDVLKRIKDKFEIINYGLTTIEWDPSKDSLIEAKYSASNLQHKQKNKFALSLRLNLEYAENLPFITIIDGYDNDIQQFIDNNFIEKMIKMNYRIIFMSTYYDNRDFFQKYHEKYSQKFHVLRDETQVMKHLVIAGSDFILMPYYSSPTDSNVLKSLYYGTIPIAINRGLYADVIKPFDGKNDQIANGYLFEERKQDLVLKNLDHALRLYADKNKFKETQVRCMSEDYSWDKVGHDYFKLYSKLCGVHCNEK